VQCCHETGLRRRYPLVVAIRLSQTHFLPPWHQHPGFQHDRAEEYILGSPPDANAPEHSQELIQLADGRQKIMNPRPKRYYFLISISWRRQELSCFTNLLFLLQSLAEFDYKRMQCVLSQAISPCAERVDSDNNFTPELPTDLHWFVDC